MQRLLTYIGLGVLLVAAVLLGWQLKGQQEPRVVTETQTDTVYAERQITKRDTITQAVPERVTIYEREVDTVSVCRSEPRSGFGTHGFITRRPVRVDDPTFGGPSVTLTYWRPDSSRFEQQSYDIPEPDWRLWPDAGAEYGAAGLAVDARLNLEWQRLHVYGGYELSRYGHGVLAGIRVRPFTLSW